ncbi:hypothetical protein Bbelb_340290 [Branchiostoma belcheri]|nr:hypothetical protein Bbelb_340290 [Branchiostoma belcheri]
MPPRGTICCRGSFSRGEKVVGARNLLSGAKTGNRQLLLLLQGGICSRVDDTSTARPVCGAVLPAQMGGEPANNSPDRGNYRPDLTGREHGNNSGGTLAYSTYPEPCLVQIYVLGYAETIQNHA